ATTIGGAEIPRLVDELPLIALLASMARGTTTVTGAAELRAKESDRIDAVVTALRAIGSHAEARPPRVVHPRGSARSPRGAAATIGWRCSRLLRGSCRAKASGSPAQSAPRSASPASTTHWPISP